jgi:2,3-bisphosphoglycerate-independent phosphoglycerate mutase
MDAIRDKHNFVPLDAHGLAVGLKEGLMGNSEVGWVIMLSVKD